MSKKAKQYSATEKTKIVIEAIKAEMTIAQISSKLRWPNLSRLKIRNYEI